MNSCNICRMDKPFTVRIIQSILMIPACLMMTCVDPQILAEIKTPFGTTIGAVSSFGADRFGLSGWLCHFPIALCQNGYWILLTSLFVCQISYFATKSRLKLRTLGTLLGVILGIPILYFVPSIEGQLLLTVIFGVGFSICVPRNMPWPR